MRQLKVATGIDSSFGFVNITLFVLEHVTDVFYEEELRFVPGKALQYLYTFFASFLHL